MAETYYRVVLKTEQIDKDGNVEDVISEDILAERDSDDKDGDGLTGEMGALSFHNTVRGLSENV